MPPRVNIAGLPIDNLSMAQSADLFVRLAAVAREERGSTYYSTSANGQVIAECQSNPSFKADLLSADQIHADGMSLVLFSRRFLSTPLVERVATTDLIHAVAARSGPSGPRFYLLGASEEANLKARNTLAQIYPSLQICGGHHGYFDHDHPDDVIADIHAKQTDILWIGFGIPREQEFVRKHRAKLQGVAVIKTSGGLFDFLSGKNSRAPKWMQNAGLEWLYRLILEPRRLAKRYLLTNPIALYAMLRDRKG